MEKRQGSINTEYVDLNFIHAYFRHFMRCYFSSSIMGKYGLKPAEKPCCQAAFDGILFYLECCAIDRKDRKWIQKNIKNSDDFNDFAKLHLHLDFNNYYEEEKNRLNSLGNDRR